MTRNFYFFLISLFLILQSCQQSNPECARGLKLWYTKPANRWVEALPIGNGRLGGMVYGDPVTEHIQLNEESIWTGGPINRANPEALKNLDKVRQLLFEGKYVEGDRLAQQKIMGTRIDQGKHTYQTLGDFFLKFKGLNKITNYKRSLDLRTAIAQTKFESAGTTYYREIFSSSPDELITIKLSASQKGKINFTGWFERPGKAEKTSAKNNQLIMTGFAEYNGRGTRFASIAQINNKGGELSTVDNKITVTNADEVIILISGRTNHRGNNEKETAYEDITKALTKNFSNIKNRHIDNYSKLFNRVDLAINSKDTLFLPTDKRVNLVKKGGTDPHLTELYFQFGRYLLISSSRPGGLPANLQGIWEKGLTPPWNADYHININLQMNYWPALVTNLAECQEPFFNYINGLRKRGEKTAKEVYGCRGFVAHHTTDIWQYTDPIGMTVYGMWPMGAAWCSDHFWEHYHYTGDTQFLKDKAYPVLKDAALFFVDFLVKNPKTNLLVSGPSMSPENSFIAPNGQRASVCMGPAMDHQIIRELFTNCIKTTEILNIDKSFADTLRTMLTQLTPSQIGSDGRILEWSEELPEAEPGHRHMSHLYALYPGEEFTNPADRKWLEASRKSIEGRLQHGGGHTGWSRAWIINFYARLQDSEKAHENLLALYSKSTHPNLFDNHPPFQIDGNFGATAGIAEMLLQSHNNIIQVLPALPKSWNKGHIKGLRARGGFIIDIYWEKGELSKLTIKSLCGNPCKIKYSDKIINIKPEIGETINLDGYLKS